MFKLNLKIAWRNLWKNRTITSINVGGLSIALAAFILVMLYATYETSFDKKLPNYKNIYMVGRVYPDFKTNYTAPPLAKAIQQNFDEVEKVGVTKVAGFEFALSKDAQVYFMKNCLILDYNAAQMFDLKPSGGLIKPYADNRLMYVSKEGMQTLFPTKKDQQPEIVAVGGKSSGHTMTISGMIATNPQSNLTFDGVAIANELDTYLDYGYNNYNTYIQVKSGADIKLLEEKITSLYRKELLKGEVDQTTINEISKITVFLDPLKNLHLKPKAGTDANYKILIAISVLGFLILVIAGINFTNLSIAQATKRAKEVGVKKVMGAYRFQLTIQFLLEVFMQCFVATILGLILAELVLPKFNSLFMVDLAIWRLGNNLFWQLILVLLFITIVAGLYPSLVLSKFNPAAVLKGNFSTSRKNYWLRNGLLIMQFTIAVIFIIGLLTVNSQLKYMRTQDIGFNTNQVVNIKNLSYFSTAKDFEPIREKVLKIQGVKSATVASEIPVGAKNGSNSYSIAGKEANIDFLDVDFDYFETLSIKLKEGRFFSKQFNTDTANAAILNESAVARYNLQNPIGKIVRGCNMDYKIVGVIKDFKVQGFQEAVKPTIYAMKNPCGNSKVQILLKIEEQYMATALASLKSQWPTINKLDGENFRYEFLDELYGKLFKKQEQLQSVFFAAALLTIFIAILGLFAFAKYMTTGKRKEIAVRKILGANDLQIFKLINTSFFVMVVVANVISWPLAYILIKMWLETFAYRIDMPILPFVLSAVITILLTIITVTIQANRAVRANPVDALKYE